MVPPEGGYTVSIWTDRGFVQEKFTDSFYMEKEKI